MPIGTNESNAGSDMLFVAVGSSAEFAMSGTLGIDVARNAVGEQFTQWVVHQVHEIVR